MRSLLSIALLFVSLTALPTFAKDDVPKLQTVSHVDLERYAGLWYEIASIQKPYQVPCTGSTAEYEVRKDGRINVTNKCHLGSLTGREQVARGIARVIDKDSNAKWRVSFFWPFKADYQIIELGENYDYAVIGISSRDNVWIFSRQPTMDETLYQSLLHRLETVHHYDVSKITRVTQN